MCACMDARIPACVCLHRCIAFRFTPFPSSQTLKQHYVPRVADVAARLLSPSQLAKPEEDLGQYLDLSHSEVCAWGGWVGIEGWGGCRISDTLAFSVVV